MKSISVKAVLRVVGEGRLAEKAKRAAQQAMPAMAKTGLMNFILKYIKLLC